VGWFKSRDLLDRVFEVGIILKGLDGILELIGGILLLTVSPTTINRIVCALTQHELSEDPHDLIATGLLRISHGLTGSATAFAAAYLLLHGAVKIILVAALLRNRLWAYPWMIAFLVAFIGYQLYRIALHPTLGLTMLTIVDAAITWLTWRQYRRQRSAQQPPHGIVSGSNGSKDCQRRWDDRHRGRRSAQQSRYPRLKRGCWVGCNRPHVERLSDRGAGQLRVRLSRPVAGSFRMPGTAEFPPAGSDVGRPP